MQDKGLVDGDQWPIGSLLIDAPGENALRNNSDHFVKRGGVEALCPSCCATALFALQTNAPSGGVGYRTSLRGGGPLTTLILPGRGSLDSLWATIWLNVLGEGAFLSIHGKTDKIADSDKFPWLAPTRTSEKAGGVDTTAEDVHPTQMFWGMPRRIRLDLDTLEEMACGVCGLLSPKVIRRYRAKNYGVNYSGPWLHPLSPHSRKDGVPLPIHAQPGGVSYRHWLGLVQEDDKRAREPALVVHHFREYRQNSDTQFRLWSFGYDMDNMKARCWYESIMPLIPLSKRIRESYEQDVASMVRAASEVAGNLKTCVKKAWFRRPADIKGDTTFVDASLWQSTEDAFHARLHDLRAALEGESELTEVKKEWHRGLCQAAARIFDVLAWEGPMEDSDPKRVVLARRDLMRFNNGKKIVVDLLNLPKSQERRL
jgi:CRISPR system Cascade subunit CasA